MDSYYGLFTTSSLALYTTMDDYYFWRWSVYNTKWWWWHYMLLYVVMISTTCYHNDVNIIHGSLRLDCCIQPMSREQSLQRMSPSSMCVYTKDNASLQSTYLIMLVLLVKLFSSYDTHVPCHVLYCSMPLYNLACYCIVCYMYVLR